MIRIMRHGLWEVIMETCLLDQYHNSKCIIFGLCEINRQTNTQHLEFSSKLLSHYLSHIILTMRNLSWKWRIFKFRCNIYIYIYIYIHIFIYIYIYIYIYTLGCCWRPHINIFLRLIFSVSQVWPKIEHHQLLIHFTNI